MTQRDIPSVLVEALNQPSSSIALLPFLTITHPSLAPTVRVVSDHFDYVFGGNTYAGMPFDARPMTDGENAPFAQLVMQNVNAAVSRALETAEERAQVVLTLYASIDFDLTQDPRVPISNAFGQITPGKVYEYAGFELTQIEVTPASITGRVSLPDYGREPWPPIQATEDRYPGLFI
ncbi:MAG: DUF1833 family protein [Pseudomonadota bacterium]